MKVIFTIGPNTFERQKSGVGEFGEPILLEEKEAVGYKQGECLLQDGENTYILVNKLTRAAYIFDKEVKNIVIYQGEHVLQIYNFDSDTFSILATTPESLVSNINKYLKA